MPIADIFHRGTELGEYMRTETLTLAGGAAGWVAFDKAIDVFSFNATLIERAGSCTLAYVSAAIAVTALAMGNRQQDDVFRERPTQEINQQQESKQ